MPDILTRIVALVAALPACFGPSLPALACGDGNVCPAGLVCRLPQRTCELPSVDAAVDPDVDGAPGIDAAPGAPLINRGLLVRYFLDEAATGTAPSAALDSASDPFNLPLAYLDNMDYTEIAGNRGLRWASAGENGGAALLIGNSKVEALDGATVASYEVVVDFTLVSPSFSRMIHVGPAQELGDATLGADLDSELTVVYSESNEQTTWPAMLVGRRQVIHTVFDSSEVGRDRLRHYVDGALVGGAAGDIPNNGAEIVLDNNAALAIGNAPGGQRSFRGVIYYAAIYVSALSAEEVASNAARLIIDDDGP